MNERGVNMFFLKKSLEDGSVIETQLNESDEYYCYCPKCGKKVKVDFYDIVECEDLEASYYCNECNEQFLKEKSASEDTGDPQHNTLIKMIVETKSTYNELKAIFKVFKDRVQDLESLTEEICKNESAKNAN